jgi:hypothetical protein
MRINDQWHSSQTQMKISGPAFLDAARVHDMQTHRIGKSEVLIGKPALIIVPAKTF